MNALFIGIDQRWGIRFCNTKLKGQFIRLDVIGAVEGRGAAFLDQIANLIGFRPGRLFFLICELFLALDQGFAELVHDLIAHGILKPVDAEAVVRLLNGAALNAASGV